MARHRISTTLPLLALLTAPVLAEADKPDLPPGPDIPGFEQLLPRGAIAALVEPEMVAAAEADLPTDAWVLGFVADDGQAFAYDLNLLNHHEVVNHSVGDQHLAAVW